MKKLLFLILLYFNPIQGKPTIIQQCKEPRIFIIKDFLSNKECDQMIKIAQPKLERSTVVGQDKKGVIDFRRTSYGYCFDKHSSNSLTQKIEKRIAKLTNLPIENGEGLQVLHYKVGGEYQPHYDYFDVTSPGGLDCLNDGGQRIASVVMYLNTPKKGGETIFPRANISITPKKGDAVLFYNCTENGIVDPNTLHGGAPVLSGEKWIMTKWIREREFRKN